MPLVCMVYVQYARKVKQVDFIDITTEVRSSDEIRPKSMKTGNLEWHKVQGTDSWLYLNDMTRTLCG